jgi:hypothetical protein
MQRLLMKVLETHKMLVTIALQTLRSSLLHVPLKIYVHGYRRHISCYFVKSDV